MLQSNRSLGLVLGLIAVALFGGSLPATRVSVLSLDPWFCRRRAGGDRGRHRPPGFLRSVGRRCRTSTSAGWS